MRTSRLLLLAALAHPLGAQSPPTLDGLDFMSGCWEGSFSSEGVIEERYTPPSVNLMLGTTRYLVGDRAVQFEFTAIRTNDQGEVELHPAPGGRPSPHAFTLTALNQGPEPGAVFEAPANEFPKRIVYRRIPGTPDTLVARIDNGAGAEEAQEWRMAAVACAPTPAGP